MMQFPKKSSFLEKKSMIQSEKMFAYDFMRAQKGDIYGKEKRGKGV
jgi:hypothetical protein